MSNVHDSGADDNTTKDRAYYEAEVSGPGKFEGEAAYVPYFWDAYLNGMADDDTNGILTFNVTDDDRLMFPELEGRDAVYLFEDDNGFVGEAEGPAEDDDDLSGRFDASATIDVNALDEFTTAYIEAALWSSTDDEDRPLDDNYGAEDLSADTLRQMVEDCRCFQDDHAEDIADDPSRAGHDFWLTRNRHGAGFWDGDWPAEIGKRLTDAAHIWGSVDLVVGDDGKIYG